MSFQLKVSCSPSMSTTAKQNAPCRPSSRSGWFSASFRRRINELGSLTLDSLLLAWEGWSCVALSGRTGMRSWLQQITPTVPGFLRAGSSLTPHLTPPGALPCRLLMLTAAELSTRQLLILVLLWGLWWNVTQVLLDTQLPHPPYRLGRFTPIFLFSFKSNFILLFTWQPLNWQSRLVTDSKVASWNPFPSRPCAVLCQAEGML